MLLECLIKRRGPTTVLLEGVRYTFMPIPGTVYHDVVHKNPIPVRDEYGNEVGKRWEETTRSEPAEESTSVGDVGKDAHVAKLLATGQYRKYNQEQAIKEAEERRKNSVHPYPGCSIEKYQDLGYIVVRKDSAYPFAGADGIWRKERQGSYFKSEIEAFDFLREEAAANPPEKKKNGK